MRALISAALLSAALCSPAVAGTLTVKILNVKSDAGVIRLCVFSEKTSKPQTFPDCFSGSPLKTAQTKIKSGQSVIAFKDVPDGAYAISLFHDEDADGRIAMKSLLGIGTAIPQDGIGISNNPTLFGKPSFDEARFPVKGDTAVEISMKYF